MYLNFFLELKIAFRYLLHRTGEGFISLVSLFAFIGIALGVAVLIIVMSVMNGFHDKLINSIIGIGGHIEVTSTSPDGIKDYHDVIKIIRNNDSIIKITPLIQGQSLATIDNNNSGVLIFGIENPEDKKSLLKKINTNDLLDFNNQKKIIIGTRLAEMMGLKVGDYLQLVSSKSVSSVVGEIPRSKRFEIGATFESGIYDFDSSAIFMPLKQARLFFQIYDSVNKLEIFLQSPNISNELVKTIRNFFNDRNDLIISDWQSNNSHYLGALESEKSVMFLILSLIILIAIFNIISSLVMMVHEKQKSIAVLRSFGMSSFAIMRIFIYCGMIIAFVGTLLGVILGILFTLNINFIKSKIESIFNISLFDKSVYLFNEMPTIINYYDILFIVIFVFIASLIVVLYPSRKASKVDPASVLRYL